MTESEDLVLPFADIAKGLARGVLEDGLNVSTLYHRAATLFVRIGQLRDAALCARASVNALPRG